MSGKQVKQSTFDAIVREAMNDFGLSAEEAVADAREQLKLAGVTDFSNLLDPTASVADEDAEHPGVRLPREIGEALDELDITKVIQLLTELAGSGDEVVGVAGANGGVDVVIDALDLMNDKLESADLNLVSPVCKAIVALCAMNEANRSRFITERERDGVELLKRSVEEMVELQQGDCVGFPVLDALQALSAVQRRCESVKQRIAKGTFLGVLLKVLHGAGRQVKNESNLADNLRFITETCRVLRQSLAHDDSTATVSEAFNRAGILSGDGSATESGLLPLSEGPYLVEVLHFVVSAVHDCAIADDRKGVSVLAECMSLARCFAVSDAICSKLTAVGFDGLAISMMQERSGEQSIIQSCMSLLRNLAGRDECKTLLFSRMGIVRDVAAVYVNRSPLIVEYFCGFVASMCLRRADIARWTVSHGVFQVVLEGMKYHEKRPNVQRIGCLAIRNACARDESVQQAFRDAKTAEQLVRKAWKMFPRECDEFAYNALRDLDVLTKAELRRDERYTMPDGFYALPISTHASSR